MQYHIKLSTYLEYSPKFNYKIDSLINLQGQPTNSVIAKYMDTNIWMMCVKMTFQSSFTKWRQAWGFQVNLQIWFCDH
jgi:hypothetical protein